MMTLDELKTYLRVDTDAEDDLLQALQHTAEEYLTEAGVPMDYSPRYSLAVKGLVLHYYDHRDDDAPIGQGLRLLINQLKFGAG